MENRVRFAPSPTGKVHVGNIRTAIFNWLFARHTGGEFLLRVEDTDLERSTQEAIDALMECMQWLGLDYDGEVMYQSKRADAHVAAVQQLVEQGDAYKAPSKDGEATPTLFRIPNDESIPCVREVGEHELTVHPEEAVVIDVSGINYAQVSKKGKPVPEAACLAGFKELKIYDADGNCVFELAPVLDDILAGKESFEFTGCTRFEFVRREVFYTDIIKGELSKPLDTVKDLVVVRSDGSPVFHIANVVDDMEQKITHIVRGDDHVENTYRHILLFNALGYDIPQYAHMPMIVNKQGKPYSKRDGDAFVGDFRDKGYSSDAFFNALALLGWSPGDDREKMARNELVEAFELSRVKSSPAQLDMNKMSSLNGLYIAELDPAVFVEASWTFAQSYDFMKGVSKEAFDSVAALLQSRTKLLVDVAGWSYFFSESVEYVPKVLRKALKDDALKAGVKEFGELVASADELTEEFISATLTQLCEKNGLADGKLNQPVRVCSTGLGGGADLHQTLLMIGGDRIASRIVEALNTDVSV